MTINIRELMPYQKDAVEYCRDRSGCALFMEMRLGKTLVTIRALKNSKYKMVLVVCPATVLGAWENELDMEDESFVTLSGPKIKRSKVILAFCTNEIKWALINYEGVKTLRHIITKSNWDAIIVDESTRLKNPKAGITKIFMKEFQNVKKKFILTGLPTPESPMDFFCQMSFLNGHFMGHKNFWGFREKYFRLSGYDWYPKRGTYDLIKKSTHSLSFFLTRKQAKIANKKIFTKRFIEMTAIQKKYYKVALKEFKLGEVETNYKIVVVNWLSQICGGVLKDKTKTKGYNVISTAKNNEVVYLLQNDLKNEKVVIFFRYNAEIDFTRRSLDKYKIQSLIINGDVPIEERKEIINQFNTMSINVILCQVKCAQFGIDLSTSSTVIYYSNDYSLEARRQSEDRIENPKKKEPLFYIDLIIKDSIDEHVLELLKTKNITSKIFMRTLTDSLAA